VPAPQVDRGTRPSRVRSPSPAIGGEQARLIHVIESNATFDGEMLVPKYKNPSTHSPKGSNIKLAGRTRLELGSRAT